MNLLAQNLFSGAEHARKKTKDFLNVPTVLGHDILENPLSQAVKWFFRRDYALTQGGLNF